MAESYDRSSLTAPNAAGVSIEGSRVEQAAIGATGAKTATPQAGNTDKGNAHIVALRPAPSVVRSAIFPLVPIQASEEAGAALTAAVERRRTPVRATPSFLIVFIDHSWSASASAIRTQPL
jgi:hypothetical protein